MATGFVRYHDGVEVRLPDEERLGEEIVAAMTGIARTGLDRYRHAHRPSHAKSHGLLKGELRVYEGLPDTLSQGLFARARSYPVFVRLATTPGDILADAVTAQRGMTLKVIGVEGEAMLPGHEGEVTQDFLLSNGSRFPVPDAKAFLPTIQGFARTTDKVEPLKRAVSVASRGANAALHAVGLDSASLGFLGHPPVHPLADVYYSQAPLRYGDYMAKVSVAPASENVKALKETKIDVSEDFSALRDAVVAFFKENSAEYEFRVQLSTDLERMPIEDTSKEWSEEESPYRPVARITIPAQDAYGPARRVFADDALSFSPWHGLAAHRPLGSIMRARKRAYAALSKFRHEMNARSRVEPRGIGEIPD